MTLTLETLNIHPLQTNETTHMCIRTSRNTDKNLALTVQDLEARLRKNSQHLAILQSLAPSTTTQIRIDEVIAKNKEIAEQLGFLD